LIIINQYDQCYQGLTSDSVINISMDLAQCILTTEIYNQQRQSTVTTSHTNVSPQTTTLSFN